MKPFTIKCSSCGSEDVEVEKSVDGVLFACKNESCDSTFELTPEIFGSDEGPKWEKWG